MRARPAVRLPPSERSNPRAARGRYPAPVRPLIACICLVLAAAPASAQDGPMPLTRLHAPVTVDGMPDEAAWAEVPALPLTMYAPVFRGTPTQRTDIRVA